MTRDEEIARLRALVDAAVDADRRCALTELNEVLIEMRAFRRDAPPAREPCPAPGCTIDRPHVHWTDAPAPALVEAVRAGIRASLRRMAEDPARGAERLADLLGEADAIAAKLGGAR